MSMSSYIHCDAFQGTYLKPMLIIITQVIEKILIIVIVFMK